MQFQERFNRLFRVRRDVGPRRVDARGVLPLPAEPLPEQLRRLGDAPALPRRELAVNHLFSCLLSLALALSLFPARALAADSSNLFLWAAEFFGPLARFLDDGLITIGQDEFVQAVSAQIDDTASVSTFRAFARGLTDLGFPAYDAANDAINSLDDSSGGAFYSLPLTTSNIISVGALLDEWWAYAVTHTADEYPGKPSGGGGGSGGLLPSGDEVFIDVVDSWDGTHTWSDGFTWSGSFGRGELAAYNSATYAVFYCTSSSSGLFVFYGSDITITVRNRALASSLGVSDSLRNTAICPYSSAAFDWSNTFNADGSPLNLRTISSIASGVPGIPDGSFWGNFSDLGVPTYVLVKPSVTLYSIGFGPSSPEPVGPPVPPDYVQPTPGSPIAPGTTTDTGFNLDLSEVINWLKTINENLVSFFEYFKSYVNWLDAWFSNFRVAFSNIFELLRQIRDWTRNIFRNMRPGYRPSPVDDGDGFLDWLRDFLTRYFGELPDDLSQLLIDLSGIKEHFPFSVPWDIAAVLGLLVHDPVTPSYTFTLPLPTGSYDVVVDLAPFDDVAALARRAETVLFGLGLMLRTNWLLDIISPKRTKG